MGFETSAVAGASKGAGYFISPLGRVNLIIASVFFAILIIIGVVNSVEEKSLYPLWHNTLERVISADVHLGQAVDKLLEGNHPVKPHSLFSQGVAPWVWYWVKWYFEVASCFFMMYFFVWLLYGFWRAVNNESLLRNVFLTLVTFLLVSFFMGMVLFNMSLAGKTLPDDRNVLFNEQLKASYPLHGTVKFVEYFVNRDSLVRASSWVDTGFGSAVTGISGNNVSGGNESE